MSDFKQRLQREYDELDEKLSKLSVFIKENDVFKYLPQHQQGLLYKQHLVMYMYKAILWERLNPSGD